MEEQNNKELIIIRIFDAPRDQVFQAWTDSKIISQWWGPNGVTNTVNALDARPGGAIDIVMLAGGVLGDMAGNEWPMLGTFKEVIAPEKLVYTSSAIVDNKPILECLNTVTFDEEDGKTKMTLHVVVTDAAPEAKGPLSGMKMGWTMSIDKLSKLLSL
jgi:uncharacterized protein YndB with AHSA1/START domain